MCASVCVCVCKQDLALINPQGLICHKNNQPTNQPTNTRARLMGAITVLWKQFPQILMVQIYFNYSESDTLIQALRTKIENERKQNKKKMRITI